MRYFFTIVFTLVTTFALADNAELPRPKDVPDCPALKRFYKVRDDSAKNGRPLCILVGAGGNFEQDPDRMRAIVAGLRTMGNFLWCDFQKDLPLLKRVRGGTNYIDSLRLIYYRREYRYRITVSPEGDATRERYVVWACYQFVWLQEIENFIQHPTDLSSYQARDD